MATPYKITFQPSVEKDLRKLSRENCDRIMVRIEVLAHEPFPTQAIKLKGTEGLYRIRVGDYRVIYEIDPDSNCIVIHYVRHRRDVYRDIQLTQAQQYCQQALALATELGIPLAAECEALQLQLKT